MSDDQIRDDRETTMGPPEGEAAGTEAPRRDAPPLSVRPLPPTWMDLSPEDVERLTRQVERAFSSAPFPEPAAREQGAAGSGPATGGAGEAVTGAAAGEPDQGAPEPRQGEWGAPPPASEAPTTEPARIAAEPAGDEDAADARGAEPGEARAGGRAAGPPEGRSGGRRRRRGSRGRGRRRRRENEAPAEPAALDAAADPEASFADASAAVEPSVAQAREAEAEPPGAEPAPGPAPAGEGEPGGGAAAGGEVEREPAEALEADGRHGRRRSRRRGRERTEAAGKAKEARAARAQAPAAGGERRGHAADRAARAAGETPADAPDHEAELRALESALRAGQPRSAAEIGAFDEREQMLLKDAWPDAPVRERQGPMRRRSQHGLSLEETFEARRDRMAEERRARRGTLYVVATPIGNLEDMTFRAVRVLKEVKLIAAEDTRQTAKLLNHYQIRTPLTSFFEHNEQVRADYLLRKLEEGQTIALVSDAGTPGISDPGYVLVKAAVDRGISVVPVPGACAAVAALSTSGLPTDAWAFVGFLPQKDRKRLEVIESLKLDRRTLVFYEAPTRTYETIKEMCEVLGNRDMVMIREMTKVHEEVVRGKFSKVLAEYRGREIKGEVVLVVAGWAGKIADREGLSLIDRIRLYKQESGLPLADVVRLVARETGTPKSEVYRESLKLVGIDADKLRSQRAEPAGGAAPAADGAERAAQRAGPAAEGAAEPGRESAAGPLFVPALEPGDEEAASRADEAPAPGEGPDGAAAPPVALPDTAAAAEPDLVPEPDARSRMLEDAQPDAPDVTGVGRLTAGEAAAGPASAGGGDGAGDDLAAVEVVEGRPGPPPEVPLAPRSE